jgi:hypothetical protein
MILGDVIHLSQQCCSQERTIMDAAAGIRGVVAYADQTHRRTCILSLDFRTAFDKISHDYWYNILSENGFDDTSVGIPRVLYKNAISSHDVNGFSSVRFSIESSVR